MQGYFRQVNERTPHIPTVVGSPLRALCAGLVHGTPQRVSIGNGRQRKTPQISEGILLKTSWISGCSSKTLERKESRLSRQAWASIEAQRPSKAIFKIRRYEGRFQVDVRSAVREVRDMRNCSRITRERTWSGSLPLNREGSWVAVQSLQYGSRIVARQRRTPSQMCPIPERSLPIKRQRADTWLLARRFQARGSEQEPLIRATDRCLILCNADAPVVWQGRKAKLKRHSLSLRTNTWGFRYLLPRDSVCLGSFDGARH